MEILPNILTRNKALSCVLNTLGRPFPQWVQISGERQLSHKGRTIPDVHEETPAIGNRAIRIHIEGNVRNSTGEILDFLDKQDINHGMSKKKINCSEVAAAVRKNFPEITWVSARIEGTRLILNIQEGIIPPKTNSNTSPCNLLERVWKTFEFVYFNQMSIEAIHRNPR